MFQRKILYFNRKLHCELHLLKLALRCPAVHQDINGTSSNPEEVVNSVTVPVDCVRGIPGVHMKPSVGFSAIWITAPNALDNTLRQGNTDTACARSPVCIQQKVPIEELSNLAEGKTTVSLPPA